MLGSTCAATSVAIHGRSELAQLGYELQTRQTTALTPRLQQSVRLLQMSTLEFNHEVARALADNPFLEELEEGGQEASAEASNREAGEAPVSQDGAAPSPGTDIDAAPRQGETQAEAPAAWSGDYPVRRGRDDGESDIGQWARSETTLQDALYEDLCAYPLNERERRMALYIIEALDDDGYLREPLLELAEAGQFSPPAKAEEWELALKLVQHLGPPGLAARNLPECLRLQLLAMTADTAGVDTALRIVDGHLERLGRSDYAGLARLLACSEAQARTAGMLIRDLSPRPGRHPGAVDPSCYVIPDAHVQKIGRTWIAISNRDALPRARLNDTYARMFRGTRYDDRAMMAQALQEARWLMRSLAQRTQTIQRVAQAIVARQQTFFDYGDVALRPLMLSEIAQELDMHESTVSRATSNKYLATPRGIYEFKHFFSRELATRSGGTCSAGAVRALIQEMIDEEDPQAPLSDVVLASKLAREGIVVARRTVSKYRAQIKYPPAELRRAP